MFPEFRTHLVWARSPRFWHWTPSSLNSSDPLCYHGAVHGGDIQGLRSAMAGKPLLLPHPVSSSFPSLRGLSDGPIWTAVAEPSIAMSSSSLDVDTCCPRVCVIRDDADSQQVDLSRRECPHPVRLHSRGESSGGSHFGAHCHHRTQYSQACKPTAEHMVIWESTSCWDPHRRHCCLRCRRPVLAGLSTPLD